MKRKLAAKAIYELQPQLPPDGFVRRAVVLSMFDTSLSALQRWIKAGQFPQPYTAGRDKASVAWHVDDLREHVQKIRAAAMPIPVEESDEQWKLICGHEEYEVSNLGNLRRTSRHLNYEKGRLRKPKRDKAGYLSID